MLPAYREYSPGNLAPLVACLWENVPDSEFIQRIVPDGCLDLVWMPAGELAIAGADTSARSVKLEVGSRLSGLRLRPGAAGAVLGMPASELRDREVSVTLAWGARGARLEEAMAGAGPSRRPLLEDAVLTAA